MTLEAGPRLRIVSPDTDGDPHTEPLVFASAAAIALVIDDAGVPASAAVVDHLVAVRGGAPVAELRADLAAGPGGGGRWWRWRWWGRWWWRWRRRAGGAAAPLGRGTITLRFETTRKPARLNVTARFDAAGAAVDPAAQGMTISLTAGSATIYARTLAPRAMTANGSRTMFAFHDPVSHGRGAHPQAVRPPAQAHRRRGSPSCASPNLDPGITPSTTSATATLTVGSSAFAGDLACTPNRKATVTTCVR